MQIYNDGVSVRLPTGTTTVAGNLIVGDGVTAPTLRGANGAGSVLSVNNNVTINAAATLNANQGGGITTLNIGGNWINNGTFTQGTYLVVFNGLGTSQPQTVGGTTAETFYDLTLNTAATTNTVQLLKAITVTDIVTLTKGGLVLNGNVLNLSNGAPGAIVSGGAFPSQGYVKSGNTSAPYGQINWSIGTGTGPYVFPFGKSSTEYIPLTVNVTVAGAPAAGVIAAWTYASATDNTPYPANVNNMNGTSGGNSVADRFWGITPSGYTGTLPTATITFTCVGGSSPTGTPPSERPGTIADLTTVVASPAGIAAQAWNPANYWDPAKAGQTFANNSPNTGFFQVTVPAVSLANTYVPYALADASVPLPIELSDFRAAYASGQVVLGWRTESELNNDFFVVQRTSDAESFEDLLTVKGAGTSLIAKTYTAVDPQPIPGRLYYRIKQTDYDGKHTFSKLAAVEIPQRAGWIVFPNPSAGSEFTVGFTNSDLGKDAFISIQDLGGRQLFQDVSKNLRDLQVKVIPTQVLAPGLYIVTVTVEEEVIRQKLVIR